MLWAKEVIDGLDTGVGLTFIFVGGALCVQVKVCRDEILWFEIVAEDSALLINGDCSKWAITNAKVCIHVSSKDKDFVIWVLFSDDI